MPCALGKLIPEVFARARQRALQSLRHSLQARNIQSPTEHTNTGHNPNRGYISPHIPSRKHPTTDRGATNTGHNLARPQISHRTFRPATSITSDTDLGTYIVGPTSHHRRGSLASSAHWERDRVDLLSLHYRRAALAGRALDGPASPSSGSASDTRLVFETRPI